MTATAKAIYERGVLILAAPLPLPEKSQVTVTIEAADDNERETWLRVSEAQLSQAWGDADDIFTELRKK